MSGNSELFHLYVFEFLLFSQFSLSVKFKFELKKLASNVMTVTRAGRTSNTVAVTYNFNFSTLLINELSFLLISNCS